MLRQPPNNLAMNILDSAQLDPVYCLEMADRFNMAQVTIVEATHEKEAFSLAYEFRKRRPQTTVFYRKWRNHLKDEEMPGKITPEEWVRYFQNVLEIGCVGAAYNESLTNPFSKQTDFSRKIIDLTAPRGWASVHYKIATGNPGGYRDEHLLPPSNPRFRPDEIGQSKALFELAAAVNRPRIDSQQHPLVWLAPHAYFATNGPRAGHIDRVDEIFKRVPDIPRHYLPLAIGEIGLVHFFADGTLDAEWGWRDTIDPALYADLVATVFQSELIPRNAIGHLYSVGDQQTFGGKPGQWHRFDLFKQAAFWDRLQTYADKGLFRLPYWYGKDYINVTTTTLPQFPADFDQRSIPAQLRSIFTNSALTVRRSPSTSAAAVGSLPPAKWVEGRFIPAELLKPAERVQQTINGTTGLWLPIRVTSSSPGYQGFVFGPYLDNVPIFQPDPEPDPPPAPDPDPADPLVDLTYTIRYRLPKAAVDDHKAAYAALFDFIDRVTVDGYPNTPIVVVSESEVADA